MLNLLGDERAYGVRVLLSEDRLRAIDESKGSVVVVVVFIFLVFIIVLILILVVLILVLVFVILVIVKTRSRVARVVDTKDRAVAALEVLGIRVAHVSDLKITDRVQVVDFARDKLESEKLDGLRCHGVSA